MQTTISLDNGLAPVQHQSEPALSYDYMVNIYLQLKTLFAKCQPCHSDPQILISGSKIQCLWCLETNFYTFEWYTLIEYKNSNAIQ